MENYPYSSYPDSVSSSPRSREVDVENGTWDEPNYRVKLVCSYGGKIQPRTHDNQLTYVGGDTKILAVDRNVKFNSFISKLTSLCDYDVTFKYQLPGEDLDALISVTNDEDLEHMMLEYDRLHKSSAKPARLRLFLFQLKPASFGSSDSKSESQWFVDALNSANFEAASPPSAAAVEVNNPDYLFGLDKGHAPADEVVKVQNQAVPAVKEVYAGGGERREVIGAEPEVSQAEIQRQIEELQRLRISGHEQSVYGSHNYQQSVSPPPPQTAVPVSTPAGYWPNRHVTSGPYSVPPTEQPQHPVYLIQTPAGVYQAPTVRQVTGQVSQGYYGMQRMVPEVYREQPVYNAMGPTPAHHQQQQQQQQQQLLPKYSGAYNTETIGVMRGPPEGAYAAQVSYDGAGRQVYYTTPNPTQGP